MTHRDITGTDAQGGQSGPRPEQNRHEPPVLGGLAPALVKQIRHQSEDEETDPVVTIDELGAALEGDGDRAVDDTGGKRRVTNDPSRTL